MVSYPLFLTHYMFLTGPMEVMSWLSSTPLQLMMFALLTIMSATVITLLITRKSLREVIRKN